MGKHRDAHAVSVDSFWDCENILTDLPHVCSNRRTCNHGRMRLENKLVFYYNLVKLVLIWTIISFIHLKTGTYLAPWANFCSPFIWCKSHTVVEIQILQLLSVEIVFPFRCVGLLLVWPIFNSIVGKGFAGCRNGNKIRFFDIFCFGMLHKGHWQKWKVPSWI